MGYIKHDFLLLIVDDWDEKATEALDHWGECLEDEFKGHFLKSPTGVNGTITYIFVPDGSKEGWTHSDECDRLRAEMLKTAHDASEFVEGVAMRFGGDDEGKSITIYPEFPEDER